MFDAEENLMIIHRRIYYESCYTYTAIDKDDDADDDDDNDKDDEWISADLLFSYINLNF